MSSWSSETIEYSAIFEGDKPNIAQLIQGIPTKNILLKFSALDSEIILREKEPNVQFSLLVSLIKDAPEIIEKVYRHLVKLQLQKKSFTAVNHLSNLKIIQFALQHYNAGTIRKLSLEEEINLFKAYLIITEEWTKKPLEQNSPNLEKDELSFIKFFIPIYLSTSEFIHPKQSLIQFIKAASLFKFMENDEMFSPLYEAFLKENNINHWHQYYGRVFNAFLGGYMTNKIPPYKITVENKFSEYINWIQQYCVNIDSFKADDDFQQLRNTPVFKLNQNEYLFLNQNFFLDKIFQGILFDLAKIGKREKIKIGKSKIGSFPDLKSQYSEYFSEKILLYNLLKYLYSKKNSICITGDEINEQIGDGEADFIIKDGNSIILIEFKDVSLNSKTKQSYDFEKIEKQLEIKFVKNEKGDAKGVTQLVNCIKDISQNKYSFAIQKPNKLKIYPVIILTDTSFSALGINSLLNQEFRKQLDKENLEIKEINNLTLINLDSLIRFQDFFADKKLNLKDLLKKYHKHTKVKKISTLNSMFKKYLPFDNYLRLETDKLQYRIPRILKAEITKIIEGE